MAEKTLLITTLAIRLDARQPFAIWQERMNKVVAGFPGFISLEMRPQRVEKKIEWTTVHRFCSHEELLAWKHSTARKELLNEVKPFLATGDQAIREEEKEGSKEAEGVTEVFVTYVTPENYEAYRKWAFEIQQIEAQFPGYQGIYIQAPDKEKGGSWITLLRFDTQKNLEGWLNSEQRKRFLKESESFVKDLQNHRIISPFAGWFAGLSKDAGTVPERWKQTMLVLLVLFPIVMLELRFLTPLTRGWNPSLATFMGNAISVSLVSWPLLPFVIRFLRWWLASRSIWKAILGAGVVAFLYLIEVIVFWNLL